MMICIPSHYVLLYSGCFSNFFTVTACLTAALQAACGSQRPRRCSWRNRWRNDPDQFFCPDSPRHFLIDTRGHVLQFCRGHCRYVFRTWRKAAAWWGSSHRVVCKHTSIPQCSISPGSSSVASEMYLHAPVFSAARRS
jgi:hypothetical protein